MISVRNLSKRFGDHTVLHDVSFDVERGETVAVLGASGSGKTTLLRCLVGLEWGDSGEVEVDGVRLDFARSQKSQINNLHQVRKRCGLVFQQFHLFPHKTVLQNLALAPRHVLQAKPAEAEARALALLRQVGLEAKANERPARLSGGEQQRVAIARALAMQPAYLLYDEPTSSLDRTRAREIWSIMRDLASSGQTQVIVTHQEELTQEIPCRILRL